MLFLGEGATHSDVPANPTPPTLSKKRTIGHSYWYILRRWRRLKKDASSEYVLKSRELKILAPSLRRLVLHLLSVGSDKCHVIEQPGQQLQKRL